MAEALVVPDHQPKEPVRTLAFTEILLQAGCELSDRDSVREVNRCLRREGKSGLKLSTYNDFCRRKGEEISHYAESRSKEILQEKGFAGGTIPADRKEVFSKAVGEGENEGISREKILEAVSRINAHHERAEERVQCIPESLELAEQSVYVSIDDVGVKHQKERRKGEQEKQNKYVQNTVISIQAKGYSAVLTEIGMDRAFRGAMACMLQQNLMEDRPLVFFTDGARNIQANIEAMFGFRPYTMILDWYHLKKRCQEYLSMSVKGREQRNEILQKLLRILWVGNTNQAITYLKGLSEKQVRSVNRIGDLCGYFEKHRSHIPCYALRKELGLRISSNRVEKANDLVVAERQKHNGMSWSNAGSGALAQIKALFLNGWQQQWLFFHHFPAFDSILPAA